MSPLLCLQSGRVAKGLPGSPLPECVLPACSLCPARSPVPLRVRRRLLPVPEELLPPVSGLHFPHGALSSLAGKFQQIVMQSSRFPV